MRRRPPDDRLMRAQAAYYLATGLWPLLHRRSFEAVTGPKVDFWLVQTVGVLVTAIGAGLALASRRRDPPDELRVVAGVAAAGLAAVDVVHVGRRRIRAVYLVDAVVDGAFALALIASTRMRS